MAKSKTLKTAWLVGLYTNDIEHRIKRLGYKLTHYYPDLDFSKAPKEPPVMIVFSDYQFSNPECMERLRLLYPKVIMISLPVYLPSDHPSYHQPMKSATYGALLRLITSIQEMETRWEN